MNPNLVGQGLQTIGGMLPGVGQQQQTSNIQDPNAQQQQGGAGIGSTLGNFAKGALAGAPLGLPGALIGGGISALFGGGK